MLTVWSGLGLGALYVLIAVGFNVVYVASGIFNFALPYFFMVGTFISYAIVVVLDLPIALALLAGAVVGAFIGILEELIAIRPLSRGSHGELVTTVGWSVILEGIVLLIWEADPRRVSGLGSDTRVDLLGASVSLNSLLLIVLALLIPVAAHTYFRRTRLGLAALATAEDAEAAQVRGVNTRSLSTSAFAVAGGLLGALGAAAAPTTFAIFSLGAVLVLKAFVAMAIGGFGSFLGCLIGGFVVGLTEAFSGRYLGTEFINISTFVLLIGVLLFIPQGLFGERKERVV